MSKLKVDGKNYRYDVIAPKNKKDEIGIRVVVNSTMYGQSYPVEDNSSIDRKVAKKLAESIVKRVIGGDV